MKGKRRDEDAARWYVAVDQSADARAERRMLAWLERDASNADALARCEAAVEIAKNLANDSEAGWAFREARWLASAGRSRPNRVRRWLANPLLAWSIAGACAALALLALRQGPNEARPDAAVRALADVQAEHTPLPDFPETLPLALVSAHPVVVLPGNIVVDANSLAILPFSPGTQASSAGMAATLHDDLVSALASIPGLYPVGGETVAAYAGTALPVTEVAAQLGTRGIVTGTVAVDAGQLSVTVRLTDASTGRVLLEAGYERGAGELYALEREMASAVALALAHATRPAIAASR